MVNGPRKHGTDDFCETSSLTVKIIPTNVLANLFKDIDLTKTYFRIFAKIWKQLFLLCQSWGIQFWILENSDAVIWTVFNLK